MTGAILVTGAGGGIGRCTARTLTRAGHIVGVLDADPDAAHAVAEELGEAAVPLTADIRDAAAVESAIDHLTDARPDAPVVGAVCNAGIVEFGPLLELDEDRWRRVVDVNLTGTFLTARAVARRMIDGAVAGSIVTVTSMNGVAAGPNAGAYGATKAAVARLTQQMALEWGSHGIRCNAVAPGLIDAGMSAPIYADDAIRDARRTAVPLRRLGTDQEVADVVAFLLSDEASYVNATEVLVDGGVTASIIARLPRPADVDAVGPDPRP